LLAEIYPAFDVEPCPLPEPALKSRRVLPRQWAQALAYFKARAVADRFPGRWVLGADTIVACDGQVLGKPRDLADARRMLELQARVPSDVITGLALLCGGDSSRRLQRVDTTRVWMRDDPTAREAYLASGDWAGKAGAYGIQNVGDQLVERYEGSFSNVVGLPLEVVAALLRAAGLPVSEPAK
jgi:septum formation protein